MSDLRQSGFTLIELTVAVAALAIMLAAVGGAMGTVNTTVETHSRSAEAATLVRRNVQRISGFARPARLATFTVQAVQQDVTNLNATAVGEWIPAPAPISSTALVIWRPGIRFQAASGKLFLNAALSTAPRTLTFEMEPGELANGLDDDGDGLVDEGAVTLVHDSITVTVVRNIETCEFAIEGRILTSRLRVAIRDSKGRIHRAYVEQQLYMRNN